MSTPLIRLLKKLDAQEKKRRFSQYTRIYTAIEMARIELMAMKNPFHG